MSNTNTNDDMVLMLQEEARRLGSQRELARRIGISEGFLTDILKGRAEVTQQVAQYFGYRKIKLFVED